MHNDQNDQVISKKNCFVAFGIWLFGFFFCARGKITIYFAERILLLLSFFFLFYLAFRIIFFQILASDQNGGGKFQVCCFCFFLLRFLRMQMRSWIGEDAICSVLLAVKIDIMRLI